MVVAADEAPAGLRVEQLVGEDDTRASDGDRFPHAYGACGCKGMLHAAEHAGVGLRTDFNKCARVGFAAMLSHECGAGLDDELTKERAARAGRVEIRPRRVADALPGLPVVAELRMVEREPHEIGKRHGVRRVGRGQENLAKHLLILQ